MPQDSSWRSSKTPGSDILRTLPDDKAFYFYNGVGAPLDVRANNLEEFAQKASNVNANSVEFHLKRHDFENWIMMIGDISLAEQITALGSKALPPLQSQQQLIRIVQLRLSEIKKTK